MNFHLQSITQSRWRIWVMDAGPGRCHIISCSIAYYQPTSGQIENNGGARMTIDTRYHLFWSANTDACNTSRLREILPRYQDTTNSLSSVTNERCPGTEYTDNYLLSSGFWPRVKLKNYHHPVRPLSSKRFQLLIVRAQSMDKRLWEQKLGY